MPVEPMSQHFRIRNCGARALGHNEMLQSIGKVKLVSTTWSVNDTRHPFSWLWKLCTANFAETHFHCILKTLSFSAWWRNILGVGRSSILLKPRPHLIASPVIFEEISLNKHMQRAPIIAIVEAVCLEKLNAIRKYASDTERGICLRGAKAQTLKTDEHKWLEVLRNVLMLMIRWPHQSTPSQRSWWTERAFCRGLRRWCRTELSYGGFLNAAWTA
jgi:hypothetical protein